MSTSTATPAETELEIYFLFIQFCSPIPPLPPLRIKEKKKTTVRRVSVRMTSVQTLQEQ